MSRPTPTLDEARKNNYIRLRRQGLTPDQAQAELARRLSLSSTKKGRATAADDALSVRSRMEATPSRPSTLTPPTGASIIAPGLRQSSPSALTPSTTLPPTGATPTNLFSRFSRARKPTAPRFY